MIFFIIKSIIRIPKNDRFNPLSNKSKLIIYINSCSIDDNPIFIKDIYEVEKQGMSNTLLYRNLNYFKYRFYLPSVRITRKTLKLGYIDGEYHQQK